ncbi:MAG: amino acid adenylation domain-containing protein [Rhodococcus sp. (in: high G+C Gram-positive bacteria)]|nr:MAG: amino acid adenylation domain-containing protein [Rhodococcus sp. (in: high G+C Gram-positive bacteria)]
MHQSHWGRAGLARTSYGHAVTVRVSSGTDPETLAAVLHTASDLWWDPPVRPTRLWVEDVAGASEGTDARRRLAAECRRPATVDGPVVRVVLMRYRDGDADLVVVADRRDLDAVSLATVCDVLTGVVGADAVSATPVRRHLHGSALPPSGAALHISEPLIGRFGGGGFEDASVAVAVAAAVVSGRTEGLDAVTVPIWRADRTRPPRVLGSDESRVDLTFDIAGTRSPYDLFEKAKSARGEGYPLDEVDHYGPDGSRIGVLDTVSCTPGRVYLPCQSAPFPLTLVPVVDTDGHTALEVYADPTVVDRATAGQFAARVAQLLNGPRGPLLPRRQLFGEESAAPVGAGVRAPGSEGRIEDLVARHARERPDALAVTHGRRTLTYSELEERSRWTACGLRDRGVVPGDHVGVCLDRSIDLIVTMLAVLRSGATFVPMDVRHPPDRLAYTAHDAGAGLVVTDLDEATWGDGAAAVTADALQVPTSREVDWAVGGDGAPAYVIYTSGSTGRPKGVVVPHRAVSALLSATGEECVPTPDDTWSMFHSPAFDFSVWEIWGALATGGRLVIVPYWISRSPVEFHTLLADEHVTVLSQTPSAFVHLTAADAELDPLDSLRLVVFGGETLDPRVVLAWLDRYPESRCRLVNMYGTTETTVHVTAHTVTRRDALTGSASVGPPLKGWEIEVADEYGLPLPRGMTGEIYVGGAGVALGYLNRPGLTAGRFVAAPSGSRRYRTGDRGRIRDDGTLEHLGRLDAQVQIRGFRVEPGEVRSVLLDDPAVTAAAVVTSGRPEDPSGLGIDAYVVAAERTAVDVMGIRRRSGRFLPEHMVPRTITAVEALPLTVNGKLDVARLPEPVPLSGARRDVEPGVGPLADEDAAKILTDIWESVLGVPVSPDDNLFEIGGNSLCAIKADSMMRRLGLSALPMRELYRHPSIRGICDTLTRLYPPRPDT